jgi:hypothetical protein
MINIISQLDLPDPRGQTHAVRDEAGVIHGIIYFRASAINASWNSDRVTLLPVSEDFMMSLK